MAPSQMAATTAVEALGKDTPSSMTTAPTMVHFSFVRSDIPTRGFAPACGPLHGHPLLQKDPRSPHGREGR